MDPSDVGPPPDVPPVTTAPLVAGGRLALVLVGGAVAFNLVALAPELTPVAYLNDSAVHAEMVRSAAALLRAGRWPWTSWFPYLGLGSPQFLHYQSLGAVITGALGLVVGTDRAFALSLYLLLSTWPISIYVAARLLRLGRWPAACAAACSPFVVSLLGIGYEQVSYLFIGFGLWSQLWAMWTLPLAWGFGFRAVREGRFGGWAALFIGLTCGFHFMTGYLALLVVPVFALASVSGLPRHLARGVIVGVGGALAAAWVIVPLLALRPYASTNEFLAKGPDVNSYGARDALGWLAGGRLLDAGRLPVLTVLAAVGLVWCARHWKRDEARCLLGALVLSLVLFFGRPTLGALENLLPGHADLFMRRFLMGVQLACVFLAGIGLAALGAVLRRVLGALVRRAPAGARAAVPLLACAGIVGVLAPAWRQVAARDALNGRYIAAQKNADKSAGAEVRALVALVRRRGGGRVYAGMPTNWGLSFVVGAVPVFRYLANLDVDVVGFTLRTASLMTNPEVEFDQQNPGDYAAFAVRFLLLPVGMAPPVPATLVAEEGHYALYERPGDRYVAVVDTVGPPIVANRGDLGHATASFLASALPDEGRYPTVAYEGAPAAAPTLPTGAPASGPAGTVLAESDRPALGVFSTRVRLARRGVVLLSSSFDPGWHATVDGRNAPVEMVAPALVGVLVPAGTHRVVFTYRGYAHYPPLVAASALGLGVSAGGLALLERRRRRVGAPATDAPPPGAGGGAPSTTRSRPTTTTTSSSTCAPEA